jgi:hypothetical protein
MLTVGANGAERGITGSYVGSINHIRCRNLVRGVDVAIRDRHRGMALLKSRRPFTELGVFRTITRQVAPLQVGEALEAFWFMRPPDFNSPK